VGSGQSAPGDGRAVMVADKMTDRRVAAKVREHFAAPWSNKGPRAGRPNAGLRWAALGAGSRGRLSRLSDGTDAVVLFHHVRTAAHGTGRKRAACRRSNRTEE